MPTQLIATRILPKQDYCGLTIVMSNPSRLDLTCGRNDLLTATGGLFFNQECLMPNGYNKDQCEIRLKENTSELLPNTKCVMLLGEEAMHQWLGDKADNNTIGEMRGSPIEVKGIPFITSYLPQEAIDVFKHEERLNPLLQSDDIDDEDKDDKEALIADKRRHGKTRRQNWSFWLDRDVNKICRILSYGRIPPQQETEYKLYPSSAEIIHLLTNTVNQVLYIDIETDKNLNILCFAFGFSIEKVYIVPVLEARYKPAYSNLPLIFRALAYAFRRNTVVAHNGALFDFPVFATKYSIGIGRKVYDTLVAQHRTYPLYEKSLGHCTSLWTYEIFHKDEADFSYRSESSCQKLWYYCGKDVSTMIRVREAQLANAARDPGLLASINQANDSIRPYLITSLLGIRYVKEDLDQIVYDNDRKMEQLLRMLRLCLGEDTLKAIRGTGKSSMPGSSKQCARYFHDMLGYPVVGRSKKTGEPALGEKQLLKLKLKHENPVIDIVLEYRRLSKESGSLGFTPWKI